MNDNLRQRKRVDEFNTQSSSDGNDRNIVVDPDDRRSRNRPSIPLSYVFALINLTVIERNEAIEYFTSYNSDI